LIQGNDRVLVSGGAGFIGSHLVDELVESGYEVTVLDNLSTGYIENIRAHLGHANFRFVRGDVVNSRALRAASKNVKSAFHLAAVTSVPYSIKNPEITFEVNLNGTRNLLDVCARGGLERLIYASTCAVYGNPVYLPVDENHPTSPESPYAVSKLRAEQECIKLGEKFGFETTILRLFNVYGPRQRRDNYGGVTAQFINKLRNNEPLVIYDDGSQTRDFIHVNDVIKAFMLAINHRNTSAENIFNIASGKPTSINELAQILVDLLGSKQTKPRHLRARKGDIKHSYASIKKAETILGFKPKISLKKGLSTLI
jgi:UDP-glucose 4-epimerase